MLIQASCSEVAFGDSNIAGRQQIRQYQASAVGLDRSIIGADL